MPEGRNNVEVSELRVALRGGAPGDAEWASAVTATRDVAPGTELCARGRPSSLVRFLPDFQCLLEPASGVWLLGCGVLTSREA